MTQEATLTPSDSKDKLPACGGLLSEAIERHCARELASFHTPGHKGGQNFRCGQNLWAQDVTELPGLDELAYASGVLASVQTMAADLWRAKSSFISTNGASACLMAAIISCASLGSKILLPRNVHRSAINALVMAGLEPIWYEPEFDKTWQIWGQVAADKLANQVRSNRQNLAAVVVVSPTYGGAISDLSPVAAVCRELDVPLIVDEAHGAHLAACREPSPGALSCGADLVVHSLHKTLSAMTQTGILHVGSDSKIDCDLVRLALNMVQSSSPNYVLMASIEAAVKEFQRGDFVQRARQLSTVAGQRLVHEAGFNVFSSALQDPFHLLISKEGLSPQFLMTFLSQHGVYPETILGNGVLLLIGCGTTAQDVELLVSVGLKAAQSGTREELPAMPEFTFGEQVLPPRDAFFSRTEIVPTEKALGRIAAECFAPCPPGNPVLVPGQRVSRSALEFCKIPVLRVVVESQQGDQ